MRRFVHSDGNHHDIGDLDELREAVDDYQDFQPTSQRPRITLAKMSTNSYN
jgi:hypothetical protein